MLYTITKGMDQNIVTLHTPNGMLDKDTNATQGSIGSFVLLAQWWVGVLLTLARLPCRDVNLLTPVIGLHAEIAEVDTHIDVGKPIQLRGQLLLRSEERRVGKEWKSRW